MEEAIINRIDELIGSLAASPNVSRLSHGEALQRAESFSNKTQFGGLSFSSTVKTLSAALTVCLGASGLGHGPLTQRKREIIRGAPSTVSALSSYLANAPLYHTEHTIGECPGFCTPVSLYISSYRPETVRLAHQFATSFFPPCESDEKPVRIIVVPEWPEKDRQALLAPELSAAFILGTDYYGEIEYSALRLASHQAAERGFAPLHSGVQLVNAQAAGGKLRKLAVLFPGIAASGRLFHSSSDHGLDAPGESAEVLQESVSFLREDGSALGSERAFNIRTDGLDPASQIAIYKAVHSDEAILDNVVVGHDGRIYPDDRTLTSNGHAIIPQRLLNSGRQVSTNLPPQSELDGMVFFFVTRNFTICPPICKLNLAQAAVSYMMSECIDALSSDLHRADALWRGVSTSPLFSGDPAQSCNRFYQLMKPHESRAEFYLINTGGVGELVEHSLDGAKKLRRKNIRIEHSELSAIIRNVIRGSVCWREDPNWMVGAPESIDGVDMARFDLNGLYDRDRLDSLIAAARLDRAALLDEFDTILPEIRRNAEL